MLQKRRIQVLRAMTERRERRISTMSETEDWKILQTPVSRYASSPLRLRPPALPSTQATPRPSDRNRSREQRRQRAQQKQHPPVRHDMPCACRCGKNSPYSARPAGCRRHIPPAAVPRRSRAPPPADVSSASAAPTPHTPPIATPNSARIARKLCKRRERTPRRVQRPRSVRHSPSASAGGRYFSASRPNSNAPTGRMNSVQKMLSAAVARLT